MYEKTEVNQSVVHNICLSGLRFRSLRTTLDTTKGIVGDRDQLFADMAEIDVSEMKDQRVTFV